MLENERRASPWELAYAVAGGLLGTAAWGVSRFLSDRTLRDRLGEIPALEPERRPLWFHGASVGELSTLGPLLGEVATQVPGIEWGVTTTTRTGREAAGARCPGAAFRTLLPIDAWPAADRFLDAIHPGAFIIVETELWPRLLLLAGRRGIPTCLASARLTSQSLRRYRRAAPLFHRVLRSLDLIAARSEDDRSRFLELGADPSRTLVLGNTKLDAPAESPDRAQAVTFKRRLDQLLGERHLVVWGCLRPGEEQMAIEALRALRDRTDALWVFAPRHLPEFDRTAAALDRAGVAYVRWSTLDPIRPSGNVDLLLLDTLGELPMFYAQADVAIVGGTFGSYGGHNLMEPARFGVPVIFGRDTSSWPDDARRLLETGGGMRVHGPRDLLDSLWRTLGDPQTRSRLGRGALEAAEAGRGASRRIVDALLARGFFEGVTRREGAEIS